MTDYIPSDDEIITISEKQKIRKTENQNYIPSDDEIITISEIQKIKKSKNQRISVGNADNYPEGYLKEKATEIIGLKDKYTVKEYLRVIEELKKRGKNGLSKL